MTQQTEIADGGENTSEALFTPIEARILACLMEKELTVPDTYPLTLNSLLIACNQKSNREPQMKLTEGEVGHVAKDLADRDYIKIEYGERAHKFEHAMRKQFDIDKTQQALLTVMMLRLPQTLNDLKTRTARMTDFDDPDEVLLGLESLNDGKQMLMQHLPKGLGQREDRYTHLLCGRVENIASAMPTPTFNPPVDKDLVEQLNHRIKELEARVGILEENS